MAAREEGIGENEIAALVAPEDGRGPQGRFGAPFRALGDLEEELRQLENGPVRSIVGHADGLVSILFVHAPKCSKIVGVLARAGRP